MSKIKLKSKVSVICYCTFLLFIIVICTAMIFGIKPYVVMSGSMEPDITTGSLCFIDTKSEYNKLEEGDIIAFLTSAKTLVTHRAMVITEDGIVTKGDANEHTDGVSVTEKNFAGKLIVSVPKLGYPIWMIKRVLFKLVQVCLKI